MSVVVDTTIRLCIVCVSNSDINNLMLLLILIVRVYCCVFVLLPSKYTQIHLQMDALYKCNFWYFLVGYFVAFIGFARLIFPIYANKSR